MTFNRKLETKDRRRVDEICAGLQTLDDRPFDAVLEDVVGELRSLLSLEQSALFEFEIGVQRVHLARLRLAGARRPVSEVHASFDEHFTRSRVWALYDPFRPEPAQRNRSLVVSSSIESLAQALRVSGVDTGSAGLGLEQTELERRLAAFEWTERTVLEPAGWAKKKQLRALICDDDRLLAWVGGTADDVTSREPLLLNAIVPALRDRLLLAERLATAARVPALEAALDAVAVPVFALDARDRICEANAAARDMIDERCARDVVDLALKGVCTTWKVLRVRARGGGLHRIVIGAETRRSRAVLVQNASARWGLTPRQEESS